MSPEIAPDPPLAEQLARAITAFAERHELAPTTVCDRAVGDRSALARFRNRGSVTGKTWDEFAKYFKAHGESIRDLAAVAPKEGAS